MSEWLDLVQCYSAGIRQFRKCGFQDLDAGRLRVEDARFSDVFFGEVTLRHATLVRVELNDVVIVGGDWSDISFDEVRCRKLEFQETTLERARFSKCVFDGCTLAGIKLREAYFSGCQLKKLDFSGAELVRANFGGERFGTVNLSDANLTEACLKATIFGKVRLDGTIASRVDCSGLIAAGAEFNECRLDGAMFNRGVLTGCKFVYCELHGVDFSEADFSGADLRHQDDLDEALFTGARYDARTRFPKGFEPEAHGMALVGAPRANPSRSPRMTKEEFEVRFGPPQLLREATDVLHMCRVVLPNKLPEEWPLMFDGAVYNRGYYRDGIDPSRTEHDWSALGQALELAQGLGTILDGQKVSTSRVVPYYPFVVSPEVLFT